MLRYYNKSSELPPALSPLNILKDNFVNVAII